MTQAYLILGDEYRCDIKARELIDGLLSPDARAFGLEQVDGGADSADQVVAAISAVLASLRTRGLLGGAKVTWLRRADFLGNSLWMKDELVRGALARLVDEFRKGPPPSHVAIITAPGMDKKSTQYKSLSSVANAIHFEVPENTAAAGKAAENAARAALSEAGLRASDDVVRCLAERTGNDARCLVNEVEKLSIYAGKSGDVTVGDVEMLTPMSRELPAWDLADAFGRRDLGRALVLLRQLLFQRVSPIQLVLGVLGRIRDLTILRGGLDNGWLRVTGGDERGNAEWGAVPEALEAAFSEGMLRDPRKSHPYRQWILCRQAMKYSGIELENCRRIATEAYRKLVTSSSSPDALVLEMMFLRTMPARKRA